MTSQDVQFPGRRKMALELSTVANHEMAEWSAIKMDILSGICVKNEAIVLSGCSDRTVTGKSPQIMANGLKCCKNDLAYRLPTLPYWYYGRVFSLVRETSENGTKFVTSLTYLVCTESSDRPLRTHHNFTFVQCTCGRATADNMLRIMEWTFAYFGCVHCFWIP